LRVIRPLRKASGAPPEAEKTEESTSHIDIIHNILQNQGTPLQDKEIIVLDQKCFDIKPDNESLVSAIIKRINGHDRIVLTGTNTFSLLTCSLDEEKR